MQMVLFRRLGYGRFPKLKTNPMALSILFAYVANGERVVGYDNAEDKGGHKHYIGKEYPYKYSGLERLWRDFRKDIQRFKEEK
jgi:hypothetical protein